MAFGPDHLKTQAPWLSETQTFFWVVVDEDTGRLLAAHPKNGDPFWLSVAKSSLKNACQMSQDTALEYLSGKRALPDAEQLLWSRMGDREDGEEAPESSTPRIMTIQFEVNHSQVTRLSRRDCEIAMERAKSVLSETEMKLLGLNK